MYKPKERDWKLLKKKIHSWKEEFMEQLIKEYSEYLKKDLPASEKFWTLSKRINSDKKKKGVLTELSRSKIFLTIISLIQEGVITREDIDGFSDELKEEVDSFINNITRIIS